MDAQTNAFGNVFNGSSRKRPCPSGVNQQRVDVDVDVDGGGDDGNSDEDPVSHRRQRQRSSLPPLSLLAKCAINLEIPANTNNSHSSLGEGGHHHQNQQEVQFGQGFNYQRLCQNNSNNNNMIQQLGHAQYLEENTSPGAGAPPTQTDAPQGYGTNPLMNQEMVCNTQPNTMLAVPQNSAAPMHAPLQGLGIGASGNNLQHRQFGMTPQELMNYAVLVNILNGSGNTQTMVQQPHSTIQQSSSSNSNRNINHGGGGGAAASLPLLGTQQQSRNEYKELAKTNKFHQIDLNLDLNNKVQAVGNTIGNCDVGGGGGGGGDPPVVTVAYTENRNAGMNNRNSTNVNNNLPVSQRNDNVVVAKSTLPTHILQARQNVPSQRIVPLWTPEDEQRLSTQQCWLRKQIETFPASTRDVRTRGRNRLLDLGQLGIQCIHCKNLPQEGRGTGSSYFPAAIKSIYQSAQNMLTSHFKEDTCPLIPRRLLQQMRDAGETSVNCPRMAPKAGKSRAGGGKLFWATSATTTTGLVDTTVGIRYSDDVQNSYRSLESIALGTTATEGDLNENNNNASALSYQADDGSVLTRIEDKEKVTDFCYILMSQFFPKNLSMPSSAMLDGDEWGSDMIESEETVPSFGLCCQFCKGISLDGKQSKGIFLSSKADTMMRNKNMARMYSHLLACAPEDIKTRLMQAKNIHLPRVTG